MKETVLARLNAAETKKKELIKEAWVASRELLVAKLTKDLQSENMPVNAEIVTDALAEFCGNHAASAPVTAATSPVPAESTQPAEKPEKIDFDAEEVDEKPKDWRDKPVRKWTEWEYANAKQVLAGIYAEEYGLDTKKDWAADRALRGAINYIAHASENGWKGIDIGRARAYFAKGADREQKRRETIDQFVVSCGKRPEDLDMRAVTHDYDNLEKFLVEDMIRNGDYDRGGRGRR